MSSFTELSLQQEKFVREYLKDGNGTRAAIAAGYKKKYAECTASRLLKNVKISQVLNKMQSKQLERMEISADRVMLELARLAFFDASKLRNADGSFKDLHEIDADTRASINSIELSDDKKPKIKKLGVHRKDAALNTLAKHFKLLSDKIEVTNNIKVTSPVVTDKILDMLTPEQLEKLRLDILANQGNTNANSSNNAS